MGFSECCSQTCSAGKCGGACKADGLACATGGECCTGQCNGGKCGAAPACPGDGTACGNCIAQSCCSQLQSCIGDAQCTQDIACYLQCTNNGGGAPQCFFKCVKSQKTTSLLLCLGANCGAGTCL